MKNSHRTCILPGIVRFLSLSALSFLGFCPSLFSYAPTATNIVYTSPNGEAMKLDVHAAAPDPGGPRPIAVLIYGGGWKQGSKENPEIHLWADLLEKINYAWVAPDYRLLPAHIWPACFDDVRAAIRWAKAHAADYNADPNRVVLFGYSAGGQLATLAATTAQDDMRVQAVVGCAPVTDFERKTTNNGRLNSSQMGLWNLPDQQAPYPPATVKLFRDNSAINHVNWGDPLPPFLLCQGTDDKGISIQESLNFQSRLRSVGVTADMIIIPKGTHHIKEWDKLLPDWRPQVAAWLLKNVFPDNARPPAHAMNARLNGFEITLSSQPKANGMTFWYYAPAVYWTDALPIWNGRLSAMIFGGLEEERLQINDTSRYNTVAIGMSAIHDFLANGKQGEAKTLAIERIMNSPPGEPKNCHPLADLLIYQPALQREHITNYARSLDLGDATSASATATVRYTTPDGVTHTRTASASQSDNVIVQHLAASKPGNVSFVARLGSPHAASDTAPIDGATLRLDGVAREDVDGNKTFAVQMRVVATGGKVTAGQYGITVEGADEATLIVTAGTSSKTDENEKAAAAEAAAAAARDCDALTAKTFPTFKPGPAPDPDTFPTAVQAKAAKDKKDKKDKKGGNE